MTATPIPIAIIGLSCRFPGAANSPEKFWDLLTERKNVWSKTPVNRFHEEAFYHPNPESTSTTDSIGGHFLDQDVSVFDAGFFGISPLEGSAIDPQQRVQLESAYEAIEAAGLSLESLRGSKTAVYVATFAHDYESQMLHDTSNIAKYAATGTGLASAANRISYLFDLKGPSFSLDCGCSGSLVALHQACQSLLFGESDMGIVGGTNLILGPNVALTISNLRALNRDGRSFPFDSRGGGYGRGEGDPVRAVIRGTAVNQDGKTNGMTLPSAAAQENLIRATYEYAGLLPDDTAFVEAHGTGTHAGDKAEMDAFRKAFGPRSSGNPLRLGSVKSNIGHLENVSGLAQVIKAVLMLEKGVVPPTANFKTLKQDLDLNATNILIPTELETCKAVDLRRILCTILITAEQMLMQSLSDSLRNKKQPLYQENRSGSTSASDSGSAKSVVVTQRQETPDTNVESTQTLEVPASGLEKSVRPLEGLPAKLEHVNVRGLDLASVRPRLFVLSTRSKKSLAAVGGQLAHWITPTRTNINLLPKLAYTLSLRRTAMQWRRAVVASTVDELLAELTSKTPPAVNPVPTTSSSVTFLFSGQGAQWCGMGRELFSRHTIFRKSLQRSAEMLREFRATWDLIEQLLRAKSTSQIDQCEISQPICTAIQIALTDFYSDLDIYPNAVLGHSSGEIAAAYAAGALSHRSSLLVSYKRGLTVGEAKNRFHHKGAMLAVGIGPEDLLRKFSSHFGDQTIRIACFNSPSSVTVSGNEDNILNLKEALDQISVFNRQLKVDVAYHSHHMHAVSEQYLQSIASLEQSHTRTLVKFFSSVTGLEKEIFDADYWVSNLVSPVSFSNALQELYFKDFRSKGNDYGACFANITELKIGIHRALSTVRTPDIVASMPAHVMQHYVVHPATMDSLLQTTLPLYFHTCTSPSVVTASIDKIRVSTDILNKTGESLLVTAETTKNGKSSALVQLSAFQSIPDKGQKLVIQMTNAMLRGINSTSAKSNTERHLDMSYRLVWGTEVDDVRAATRELSETPENRAANHNLELLDRAASLYARACVEGMKDTEIGVANEEYTMFYRWMQMFSASNYANDLLADISLANNENVFRKGSRGWSRGDALEVLVKDNLLYKLYANDVSLNRVYTDMVNYLEALTFKNPNMSVLEIGRGTGGATLPLLSGLSKDGASNPFTSYTFTDISSGFFDKTREKLTFANRY
ncbi:hypothetical protein MMC13_004488 [Lambiella insularis]|nr:hypothetical protein [Lambiella insularis]